MGQNEITYFCYLAELAGISLLKRHFFLVSKRIQPLRILWGGKIIELFF